MIPEAWGYSSVAFAMGSSHIIGGMQSDAMAMLDEVLPARRNGMGERIHASSQYCGEQQLMPSFAASVAQG